MSQDAHHCSLGFDLKICLEDQKGAKSIEKQVSATDWPACLEFDFT